MRKKGTFNFVIGIIIGILILIALFYPLKAISSVFFGKSQPCISDQSKSVIDNIADEINNMQTNQKDSYIINLEDDSCAFVAFGKDSASVIIPPLNEYYKTNSVICVCEKDNIGCTENRYCRILENIDLININGFGNLGYVQQKGMNSIYYKKEDKTLTISDTDFTSIITNTNPSQTITTPAEYKDIYPLALQGGDPYLRAFMLAITIGEGTSKPTSNCPDPYRILVGFGCIPEYKHPNQLVKLSSTLSSTAAGRYQFLNSTWRGWCVRYNIPCDQFTPINQDKVVYNVLKDRKVDQLLAVGDLDGALAKTNALWASLPGATYSQPTIDYTKFEQIYNSLLVEEKSSVSQNIPSI
ncbi:MAG: hypothetical protein KJ623_04310 [Nanoarchaeota archaeon]|nr:hypothetical protein [Nanoarchaeota archaeon]